MAAAKPKIQKAEDAFRSIGEAAGELGLQTHVLRYWETKFSTYLKPVKRRDGRRFFRPADMDALRAIQLLVHSRGMTLKGAKALLDEQGIDTVLSGEARLAPAPTDMVSASPSPARELQDTVRAAFDAVDAPEKDAGSTERLQTILGEMTDIKARLDALRLKRAA